MILFGPDGVRRRTSVCPGRIYMDRAMPEHTPRPGERSGAQPLARALHPCAQWSVALLTFMAHGGGVVLQPASQKRPDSELRTANSVRALSCVSALLSSAGSLTSSCGFSPLDRQRLGRGFKTASRPRRLCMSAQANANRPHLTA